MSCSSSRWRASGRPSGRWPEERPRDERANLAQKPVEPFELPGGRVVTGTHIGPYESLAETYEQLMAWTRAEGLTLAEGMWESYLSDPSVEPDPNTWRTLIVWPLA